MNLISRQTAIKTSSPWYFTGEPCKNGHVEARRTDSCACAGCLRDARSRENAKFSLLAAARAQKGDLFALVMHPDDHAAMLAYGQMLTLQRGQQAPQPLVMGATPSVPSLASQEDTMVAIRATRERLLNIPHASGPEKEVTFY